MTVAINGEDIQENINGYLAVSRDWQDGDQVELHLPWKYRYRAVDNKNILPSLMDR